MKLTDRSVHDVLAAFRSSEPTPGGGSAAALSGAIGASLLAMVAGLPKPAAATPEDLERLHGAGARCAETASALEGFIDRDSAAYEAVVNAYRLPRATDEEKAARSAKIQEALRGATDVPLDVMRACREALDHGSVVRRFGNANAASDVQVGMELLQAGLTGARLNVEINLDGIKDAGYVEQVKQAVASLAHVNCQFPTPDSRT